MYIIRQPLYVVADKGSTYSTDVDGNFSGCSQGYKESIKKLQCSAVCSLNHFQKCTK